MDEEGSSLLASQRNGGFRQSTSPYHEPEIAEVQQEFDDTETQSNEPLPEDERKPGSWKPLSITTPVLFGAVALSILLFIIIEVLAQRSESQGGLASYPSVNEIPGHAFFAYSYLPTIVATLYSLMWNWIDLDVKRVQPWIEVSKPGGVAAKTSLLVDYTVDFLAIAPFKAAKRRHWPVVCSGTAIVFILWILTPLQTSLLGVSIVQRSRPAEIIGRSQLLPLEEQFGNYRSLNLAYAIELLNQSYPAFTTSNYTLLPFYLRESMSEYRMSTNWTAETTRIWADVHCSPAQVEKVEFSNTSNPSYEQDFSTGAGDDDIEYGERRRSPEQQVPVVVAGPEPEFNMYVTYSVGLSSGCTTNLSFDLNAWEYPELGFMNPKKQPLYEYEDSPWDCSKSSNNSISMLFYWAAMIDPDLIKSTDMNLTALQCDFSYHTQQVQATVESQTLRPLDNEMKSLSEPKTLTEEDFNFTSYLESFPDGETYLDWGNDQDWADMQDVSIGGEMGSKPAWACGLFCRFLTSASGYDLDSLWEETVLKDAVEHLHKQFFSLTVSDRLMNQTSPIDGTGTSTVFLTSIIVSRAFAIPSEVLLLLAAVALGIVCYFMSSSACLLLRTPSSIGDLVELAHNSPETVKLLETMDTADEKRLTHCCEGVIFKLALDVPYGSNKLSVMEYDAEPFYEKAATATKPYWKPIKPWILRRGTGGALVAVVIAGIAVLSYFKAVERREKGLQQPSESFEVRQLLLNYIPTVFATGFEPFWILLTRTMCIFQPFKDLWKGHSRASRSIETTHLSLPPQLAILKTIASQHVILSLLSLATLLANVLAIGLSAMFNERPRGFEYPQQFQSQYQSKFSHLAEIYDGSEADNDFMYMALANMTYGSRLPPWVATDFSFLPFTIPGEDEGHPGDEYTVETRGFGADVNCTVIPASTRRISLSDDSDDLSPEDGCEDPTSYLLNEFIKGDYNANMTGRASMTYADSPGSSLVKEGKCPPLLALGWAKASSGLEKNSTISTSFAICRPFFRTAMFDVTVDREGYVLRYQPVSDVKSFIDDPSTNQTNLLLSALSTNLKTRQGVWRNTSTTRDWMSHFMYLDTGSRDAIDPDTPAPDPAELLPSIGKIYSQLFAALLGVKRYYFTPEETTDTKCVGLLYCESHPSPDIPTITGKRLTQETRVYMDNVAFGMTIAVLALDLIVALIFYLPESLYVLPRAPTSALSVLSYIAPSRAVRDGRPASGWGQQTFSFGRYLGYDGKAHVGIEMDPYVVEKDTTLGAYKPLWDGSRRSSDDISWGTELWLWVWNIFPGHKIN